jgi:hypothetical protein
MALLTKLHGSLTMLALYVSHRNLSYVTTTNYNDKIGQVPILDLLASQYGLIDATFPVARFAQQRMTERFPTTTTNILPTSAPKPSLQPSSPNS